MKESAIWHKRFFSQLCCFRVFLSALAVFQLSFVSSVAENAPGEWQEFPVVPARRAAFGPYRMARDVLQWEKMNAGKPWNITLDAGWQCNKLLALEISAQGLRIRGGARPPWIKRVTNFHPSRYNHMRIRMRAERGKRLAFDWKNGVEPGWQSVSTPILADGAFHVYSLPLQRLAPRNWSGAISEIRLRPSDTAATVDIAEIVLSYDPPASPRRVTLGTETFEALMGTQLPWELTVPPNAIFEAHMAWRDPRWQMSTSGARFKAFVEHDGTRKLVIDHTIGRGLHSQDQTWIREEVDLTNYANKTIRIHLEVTKPKGRGGIYGYWGNPSVYARDEKTPATPVILISCDTLRAGNLPFYGYERDTAPHLSEFVDEAVVFDDAVTPEVWTVTAHVSMLTGLHPKRHNVTANNNLSEAAVTLAERLSDAGYFTAGFVGHSHWLRPSRGFSHGFDIYNHPLTTLRSIFTTMQLATSWLERHATRGMFIFFHNYDLHRKSARLGFSVAYGPPKTKFLHFSKALDPPPTFERPGVAGLVRETFLDSANRSLLDVTPVEQEYLIALYDDAIRSVDQAIHRFLDLLRKHGLYDDALIIITADHGESFGEHGYYGHRQLYEECAHVPLIIKFPQGRFAGRRVSELVELTDLAPTVLDVLGMPQDWDIDGRSLLPLLEGKTVPKRTAFIQRTAAQAVRTKEWKLIRDITTGEHELYHLTVDNMEQKNLFAEAPEPLQVLQADLDAFFPPNMEGWCLAFSGGRTGWRGTLVVTAAENIEDIELLVGDRQLNKAITYRQVAAHAVQAQLHLEAQDNEELFIKTASAKSPISITLTGPTPFRVSTGATTTDSLRKFEVVLDPSTGVYTQPMLDHDGDGPAMLAFWYQESLETRSSLENLPEETRRELEALGYVD